jgi:hypothetical protein
MTIRRLFNHTVRVYRDPAPEDARDALGFVSQSPLPVDDSGVRNARPDQGWSGTLQDHGPGEQQAGLRRWFLAASLDVRERDVLSVVEGPEAPLLLRVESVSKPANMTRHHHTEVNVSVWEEGELPDA